VASEFRAAQIEIVTPVCVAAADVARELASVRRGLSQALAPEVRLAAAGTHPTATDPGAVTPRPRYLAIERDHPWAARHAIACGLHVHVAVGGADRTLAIHNALRSYLPEIIALGANAPFHHGTDAGVATVRPLLNRTFPRFGAPPAFASWREVASFLAWAQKSATIPDTGHLWWDLRLHPGTGTIEVRAADVQTRVEDAAAIIALIQALVFDLAGRHDAGEPLAVHHGERIGESMWLATRDGLGGSLPDLDDAELTPTCDRLLQLVDALRPAAWALGCAQELNHVEKLVADGGGAQRQRDFVAAEGIDGLVARLARDTAADLIAATEGDLVGA
jgi:carboxylate-amine ligase